MPYICKDCKNKVAFLRTTNGTCTYEEGELVNENDECQDTYDCDYDNHNIDSYEDYECNDCGSNNVENVSQEEWDAWEGPVVSWKDRFK